MKNAEKHIIKFIDIIDRYLEVAFVYHERLNTMQSDYAHDRIKRIVEDLEKIT